MYSLNRYDCTQHFTYPKMKKALVKTFLSRSIYFLVPCQCLYAGFCLHNIGSLHCHDDVGDEVMSVGTKRSVFAVAMIALVTDKCHLWICKRSCCLEKSKKTKLKITAAVFHCNLCCTSQTTCEAE